MRKEGDGFEPANFTKTAIGLELVVPLKTRRSGDAF